MIWCVSLTLEATNDALICFDPKLGVPTNADDIALKRAYRKQAMKVCGNFDSAFYRCSHISSSIIQTKTLQWTQRKNLRKLGQPPCF